MVHDVAIELWHSSLVWAVAEFSSGMVRSGYLITTESCHLVVCVRSRWFVADLRDKCQIGHQTAAARNHISSSALMSPRHAHFNLIMNYIFAPPFTRRVPFCTCNLNHRTGHAINSADRSCVSTIWYTVQRHNWTILSCPENVSNFNWDSGGSDSLMMVRDVFVYW